MKKNIILVFLVSVLLSSCFKEDELILPHDKGDLQTVVIPMTSLYSNQVYFSFENGDVVATNIRSKYDLNFGCGDSSVSITLNTANFATIAKTQYVNFEDVTDTVGLQWQFDKSDGNPDSVAINDWIEIENGDTVYSDRVWVINRGLDSKGVSLGLKKIKFKRLIAGVYHFVYADMNGENMFEVEMEKDQRFENIQYSFSENSNVQFEPEKQDWDLVFTQYTTLLFTNEGAAYPYLVTGALINPISAVAVDSSLVFDEIGLPDVSSLEFSSRRDAIGYDWKELIGDVETGNFYYFTKTNRTYVVEDKNGFYYKLRFIDFYSPETGEKGYPTFEFQRL